MLQVEEQGRRRAYSDFGLYEINVQGKPTGILNQVVYSVNFTQILIKN